MISTAIETYFQFLKAINNNRERNKTPIIPIIQIIILCIVFSKQSYVHSQSLLLSSFDSIERLPVLIFFL